MTRNTTIDGEQSLEATPDRQKSRTENLEVILTEALKRYFATALDQAADHNLEFDPKKAQEVFNNKVEKLRLEVLVERVLFSGKQNATEAFINLINANQTQYLSREAKKILEEYFKRNKPAAKSPPKLRQIYKDVQES